MRTARGAHAHGRVLGLLPSAEPAVEEIDCTFVDEPEVLPPTPVERLTTALSSLRLHVLRLVTIKTTVTTTTVLVIAGTSASDTGVMAAFDRSSRSLQISKTKTTTRTEVRSEVRKLAAARVFHASELRRAPVMKKAPDPKQLAIESFHRARRRRSPIGRKR